MRAVTMMRRGELHQPDHDVREPRPK